jgi:hypothetical protein
MATMKAKAVPTVAILQYYVDERRRRRESGAPSRPSVGQERPTPRKIASKVVTATIHSAGAKNRLAAPHSVRRAIMGSIAEARRAGR